MIRRNLKVKQLIHLHRASDGNITVVCATILSRNKKKIEGRTNRDYDLSYGRRYGAFIQLKTKY